MGGYDIFSQPKGPNIDINLFSNAAKAGAEVGKEIPGDFQAAVEGGIKGIETGQSIYHNALANEEAQHTVDRFPQADALQNAQVQVEQSKATIDNINAQAAVQTQDNTLAAAKINAENKVNEAKRQAAVLSQGQQVEALLNNPATAMQALDPKFSAYYSAYPKEEDAVIRANWTRMNPQQQEAYRSKIFTASQLEYQKALLTGDKTIQEAKKEYDAAFGDPYVQSIQQLASNKVGRPINKQELLTYETHPTGMYQVDPETNKIATDAAGNKVTGGYDPQAIRTFDVFDYKGNLIGKIPKDSAEKFSKAYQAGNSLGFSVPLPPTPKPTATPDPSTLNGIPQFSAANEFMKKAQGPAVPTPNPQSATVQQNLRAKQQTNVAASATPTPQATPPIVPQPGYKPTSYYELDAPIPKDAAQAKTIVDKHPLLKGLNPELKAIAAVESSGGTNLKSDTGVKGILQVTEAVANAYGLDRNNPKEAILAGTKYLNYLKTQFPSDTLAYAAWNGGPSRIKQAMNIVGSADFDDVLAGLRYMQAEDPEHFSKKKLKEIADFPGKVMGYFKYFSNPPSVT